MTLAEQFEQQGFQRGMTLAEQFEQQGFQRGIEQGVQQGIKQGIAQGSHETSLRLASRLLNSGLSVKQVAEMVELPLSDVASLADRTTV